MELFLISLSDSLLLVFRYWTDFCILILYPATLLNSFNLIVFFVCVASLGFSSYSIRSPANSDSFTSFFPVWIPFISFYCLIAGAMTSNNMLIKSGESGHPCLVPDLRGNVFSFSLLRMMLAVGLFYMTIIMLKYFFSIPILLRIFIINRC